MRVRYQRGEFRLWNRSAFRVGCFYTYNAIPDTPKIPLKTAWFQDLVAHVQARPDKPFLLAGDFNVAHGKLDSRGTPKPSGINGCTDEERLSFQTMLDTCNLFDPQRACSEETILSTWWHASTSERRHENGIRFDYTLVPKAQRALVQSCAIHPEVFGSDHCPTSLVINLSSPTLYKPRILGQLSLL